MKKSVIIILILLGVALVVISVKNKILPPALTGVGFFAIGILLLKGDR